MSELKDLEFLLSVVRPFFKQAHIKKTLSTIHEDGISGWEKWLQIELASFLRQHASVKAWGRETQYKLDKRLTKKKSACSVDFIIHERKKQSHLAVELKQVNKMPACVQAMLRDLDKLGKIKGSEFDIRSVWCLGIHNRAHIDAVRREATYYSSTHDIALSENAIVSERIGRTEYSFTVL
jgi:hypothetical protein